MEWVAISGTWQKTNAQVEKDVRETVREIINNGDGIVSGGALGVDYFATDEALKLNPSAEHIKIFLPTSLEIYRKHYRKRATNGVITEEQAENLVTQLDKLKKANKEALIENLKNNILNQETYFARNDVILNASNRLIAFHVNNSEGTADAIKKAKAKGLSVERFSYTI